ncbi:hypothetical protein N185_36090 [Sinorhizobium sp. GW3]|nr:hypothetical protein N185_36090 [Sinorhizobium sp. GW3]
MSDSGAYGERLRKTFKVARAPSFVSTTLKNARIAVTEIRCDIPDTGLSEPLPREDAFLLAVQLRDVPAHDLFLDGKQVKTAHLQAGTSSFYDLRTSPIANSISAFNHISFYVPRAALNEITEREGIPPVDSFDHDPGVGVQDMVLYGLVRALLPVFRSPGFSNELFVDHLTVAATAHAVKRYASGSASGRIEQPRAISAVARGRVQEKLAEHLSGNIRLDELSDECGMAPLQFATAFEISVGKSIHEWRGDLRIERARRLLERGHDAETTSAMLGYGDVTDFITDFMHKTGVDPQALVRH